MRTLSKYIINNLDCGDIVKFNGLNCFFDLLDTNAHIQDLAFLFQLFELAKNLRSIVDLCWGAMELDEIKAIDL